MVPSFSVVAALKVAPSSASGVPVLSAHVVVDDACLAAGRSGEVLDRLGECLGQHFDVEHCTFQLEPVGHAAHEGARHA